MSYDRAEIVAVGVLQAVLQHITAHFNNKNSPPAEVAVLRAELAAMLRDEFADLTRQVAAERDSPED